MSEATPRANRYMLAVDTKSISETRVGPILIELGMPTIYSAPAMDHLESANMIYIGI